jgi:hypothetical protein
MCGICGMARHPDGDDVDVAKGIVLTLLERNESRGSHATGIAVQSQNPVDGQNPWIFKRAIEAKKFVKGEPFLNAWASVVSDTQIILGHTRHATHANAHEDHAAHPFQVGSVVGAHNGIIRNWREIEKKYNGWLASDAPTGSPTLPAVWVNDSQAAFGALDMIKDPVKATDELDGYFALSWIKGGKLFLCRANSPELSAAYVPSMKALFWSSERHVLADVLRQHGLKDGQQGDFDLWTCKPGTIYKYDPTAFTDKGANGTKKDAPFRGIGANNRNVIVNGANPTEIMGTRGTTSQVTGGYSTHRVVPDRYERSRWNGTTATEEFDSSTEMRRKRSLGGKNAESEMDRVWDMIAKLNRELTDARGRLTVAEAEIEHLYAALNEDKPEVFDYAEAPCCGADASGQMSLLPRCKECKSGDGELLRVPGTNEFVHPKCVMQDAH